MDAKERLRRYLEQRRELGESEFVLDGMQIDDVMSLIGAKGPSTPSSQRRTSAPADAPPNAGARADEYAGADDGPPAMASEPTAPAAPPPEPERRFDATASTDWRETLRRAGAVRPSTSSSASSSDAVPDSAAAVPARPSSDSTPRSVEVPAWLTAMDVPLGLTAGNESTRSIEPAIAALPSLDAIAEVVRACTRCDLYRTAINPVPGEGDSNADFVCVGEAPGQNEDEQGRPFVGAAGALLNKILGAIQLQRSEVFVCNVLKHRPPGNRDPLPEEVRACEPYLRRQLELVQPRVILALGRFAAQSLLGTTTPIGKLRGQIHRYHGVPLIVTYHPAALLRNEAWKRPAWDDVRLARRVLDASRAASGA